MVDDSNNIENNTKQQNKKVNCDAKVHQSLPGTAGFVGLSLLGYFGFYGSGWFWLFLLGLCMPGFGVLMQNSVFFIPPKSQS